MIRQAVHAVLTGDLVGSRRASDTLTAAQAELGALARSLPGWGLTVLAGPDLFRGDGWQLTLDDAGSSMRVALAIRAALRAARLPDSRVAIGIGRIDAVDPEAPGTATGDAFTASGLALDHLPRRERMAAVVAGGASRLAPWLRAVVVASDGAVAGWSPRQAEVVLQALDPAAPTQAILATRIGVSRQAVGKSLAGAGWRTLAAVIDAFEQTDWPALVDTEGAGRARSAGHD